MTRAKNLHALARRGPRREPYDRVLIVCEGSKTEPNYLRELVAHYRLSSANIEITGDNGSAPISVVRRAIELFEREPDYDRVFCVFDRDGHPSFDQAMQTIREHRLVRRSGKLKLGAAGFEAIASIPCFEYWILLHHRYTTAPLTRFANVEPLLKAIPAHAHYAKGSLGLFAATQHLLDTALAHADRANRAAAHAGTDNPTTDMPTLVRYLRELAEGKQR